MIALGAQLVTEGVLPAAGLVLLIGDLGAGKTTLAKGIAEARGAASRDEVSSPTFTLIHEYGEPARLFHIDLYRLDEARQVEALGLDEMLARPGALTLIEWGERFPELWPATRTEIHIAPDASGEGRVVRVVTKPGGGGTRQSA
ncbi:MAG: tRNA (adenosine(37)-N6)-threonylcarbamoyltransferase complex ATPase subunit type 1 TsaE [Bryobacterales bacterium]|nr:tRNA (adenosine(37)-N6)-threonylcarbamoyltransferase complex ATPase subunit type 1 TsaE [Bryobacterales bacterium]